MQAVLDRMTPAFVYDPSLRFWAPLRQLDSATFADRSAYGHLCTRVGAIWGLQGTSFDGDDYIDCGANLALDLTVELTILLWVKWATPANANPGLVAKGKQTTGANYCLLTSGQTTQVYFDHYNGGWDTQMSGLYAKDSAWSFVALTIRGNTVVFQVDNVFATTTKARALAPTVDNCYVGLIEQGTSYSKGTLDDIRIYSRALNPMETQRIYLEGKSRYS